MALSSRILAAVAAALACAAPACTHPSVSPNTTGGGGSSAPAGGGGTVGSGGGAATDGGGARPGDGGADAPPSRGPTPARTGHAFPFPQNRPTAFGCGYPAGYRNEDVQAAYDQWKRDTITADGAGGHLRVKRPNEPVLDKDSTVSEGIGYGMLIAVYMDDQTTFDELWKYEQQQNELDDFSIMHW